MLLLISLALNAIFLGIIGEYLARIYRQVKPGPLTIVERFVDRTEPAGSDPPGRSSRTVAGIVLPNVQMERGRGSKGAADGV
jgi:dolichol-phosphate mannosyltransferase